MSTPTLAVPPAVQPAACPRKCLLGLIAVLLVAAPPLLVDYGSRPLGRAMENVSILSSQETWFRQRGYDHIPAEENAWLRPSQKGELRVLKPPLVIWINILGWSSLVPEQSTTDQLIAGARLIAALMALIMVAATYWAGVTLGGVRVGLIAAMSMATMWFFQRQGRTASYDIHMTAWTTVGVAAGLWAIGPRRDRWCIGRFLAGWLFAGLSLGMAGMSKGLLAAPLIGLPLAAAVVVIGRHRARHVAGMAMAGLVAAALATPWYAYIKQYAPTITEQWTEHVTEHGVFHLDLAHSYYYLGLVGLIAPWSVWLIGGMFLPWIKDRAVGRAAVWVSWLWFVSLFVMFSIPAARQQRYILPAMPAAALLIAFVFEQHILLAKAGRPDRSAAVLYLPHWIGLLVMAPAPLFLAAHPWMEQRGWLEPVDVNTLSWLVAAPLALVLAALAVVGLRMSRTHRSFAAAIVTVAWLTLLTTVFWAAEDSRPIAGSHYVAAAEKARPIIAGKPVFYLRQTDQDLAQFKDCEEFQFYIRRTVRGLDPADLLKGDEWPIYVFGRAAEPHDGIMRAAGATVVVDDLNIDKDPKDRIYRLWRLDKR